MASTIGIVSLSSGVIGEDFSTICQVYQGFK